MNSGSASLPAVSLLYTHTAQTQDPDKNWQASFRCWVTHTDAQSQRCHLHTSSTSYEFERKMKQKNPPQNKTNNKKKRSRGESGARPPENKQGVQFQRLQTQTFHCSSQLSVENNNNRWIQSHWLFICTSSLHNRWWNARAISERQNIFQ